MRSPVVTIAPPAAEPIELAAAKRFLRIDGDQQDADVALLIQAARRDLELITGQRLVEQTVRFQVDTFSDLNSLPVGPATAIVAISFGVGPAAQQLDLDQVYLTGLGIERGIDIVPGFRWPTARGGPITVDVRVGYGPTGSSVPANLRHALFAIIRGKFDDRAIDIEPLVVNERIYG